MAGRKPPLTPSVLLKPIFRLDLPFRLGPFQYRELLKHPLLRRSRLLSSIHFLLRGYDQILRGDRRLAFTLGGRYFEYVEEVYLKANPDVAGKIASGLLPDGLGHFLRAGYREIAVGKRKFSLEPPLPQVKRIIQSPRGKAGHHLCLFAHFDPQGLIDPYVVVYLKTLRSLGCDIVFISESANDSELKKLRGLCFRVIQRTRGGLDLGSWYTALKKLPLDLSRYEWVIFANDSVYFPIRPPRPLFQKAKSGNLDFWGITESLQRGAVPEPYHIQSYFLGFSKAARRKNFFGRFRTQFESHPILSKCGIIDLFEYGMTHWAQELELRVGAFCGLKDCYEAAKKLRGVPPLDRTTPTLDLWDTLISSAQCPILKVGLFRDRLRKDFDPSLAKKLVTDGSYDFKLVENHIHRLNKMKVPPTNPARLKKRIG